MQKEQHTIRLTVLSPVCVGTGQTLSPYSDFVIDGRNKKIYFVDHELVKNKLSANLNLIDSYVNGVATGMDNNRSNFVLDDFLSRRLHIDVRQSHRLSLDCYAPASRQQLYTIVKNAGTQPYIPGSSLKGAVKTGLLYGWLLEPEGQQWLSSFVGTWDDQKLKKTHEKRLEHQLERYQPAFSDSTLFEEESIIVIDTKRLNIKTGELDIPQTWEAIIEKKDSDLTMHCRWKPDTVELDWEKIVRSVNRYSSDANDRELIMLKNLGQTFENKYGKDYKDLVTFYEGIQDKIREAPDDTLYMRLGSGKGYFFNSVGLAVYAYEEGRHFETFLRKYGQQKFKNPGHFPVTRPIDVGSFLPLGWVKLEVEK